MVVGGRLVAGVLVGRMLVVTVVLVLGTVAGMFGAAGIGRLAAVFVRRHGGSAQHEAGQEQKQGKN